MKFSLQNIFGLFSKHTYSILGIIVLLGFFLRVFHLWDNVFFGYDQARDAQRIMGIISLHHFKVVGPETDIPGVFNGVLYYYILAPIYFVSQLNPNGVALFMTLINSIAAIIAYVTGNILFKNKYIGLFAAFLWTISFEQIAYARYISNASCMGLVTMIFFLGCAIYFLEKKEYGLPLSAVGLALAIHFNFYLVYLFIFYGIFYFVFPKKHNIRTVLVSVFISVCLLSPFLLAEKQFHFGTTRALLGYITRSGKESHGVESIRNDITLYAQRLSDVMTYSYFSFNQILGLVLFLGLIVFVFIKSHARKSVIFLLIWIFSTLPLFVFHSGVLNVQVINSSLQGAGAILVAVALWILFENKKLRMLGILFCFVIMFSNISLLVKSHYQTNALFVSDPMLVGYQKEVIDYTYHEAAGKPFSICVLTNPLLINTTWGYIYNWYGKSRYGYIPYWAGWKQDLQTSLMPYDTRHTSLRFIIQEPPAGIPVEAAKAFTYMEDNTSTLLKRKVFGNIRVEKRLLQVEPRIFLDTQALSSKEQKNTADFIKTDPYFSCYNTY